MSDPPSTVPRAGLCNRCRWQRVVRTTRGSAFSLCERSRQEPGYPRYPRIPVERCPGFEPDDQPAPRSLGGSSTSTGSGSDEDGVMRVKS